MLRKLVGLGNRHLPGLGYFASRRWFEYISTRDSGRDMLFMNYGYAPLNNEAPDVHLEPEDEDHRYFIQLYHHIASAIDLRGKRVLEVGCGRGGGTAYVARYLKPHAIVGVDLAASAIAFCKAHYRLDNLHFERGNAENLPFADGSFDVLLNVESSICYANVAQFFQEVVRVLRPGGHFLYADIRSREEISQWLEQLTATGLEKLQEENITANVLRSLDLDNERKQRLINHHVPVLLRRIFKEFAGVKGSDFFYGAFASGEKIYKRFLFRRPLTV